MDLNEAQTQRDNALRALNAAESMRRGGWRTLFVTRARIAYQQAERQLRLVIEAMSK